MVRFFCKFLIFVAAAFSVACLAYEVDSFSQRYSPLKPADEILDRQVNSVFKKVVERVNEDKIGCSRVEKDDKNTRDGYRKLRSYLREAVAPGRVVGVFEESAESNGSWLKAITGNLTSSENVPKHKVNLDDSIYGGNVKKKMILNSFGINSTIKLGGEYIGTDKLGHFFDQGFEYYKRWTLNESEVDALQIGKGSEESFFGKATTGVKSYGDLSANYSGYLFWRKVNESNDPYFKCENGTWRQVKEFKWADFVNPTWDEGINCSEYATPEMQAAIEENLAKLEERSKRQNKNQSYTCPVNPSACMQIAKLHRAKFFVSPKCRDILKKSNGGVEVIEKKKGTK